jgi:hypothetical protein
MKLWPWRLILPIAFTATASAQDHPNHTKIAIINGLIGGSTAAVTAAVHHRSITSAFIKGSLGGLTVYAGKCLIARKRTATYWLGQHTVAIGSSMVANGATGRGVFESVVLPLGPLRIYRDNKQHKFNVKLDLMDTGVAAWYMVTSPAHVDWGLSAKHDALILLGSSGDQRTEAAGLIELRDNGAFRFNKSFRLVHEEIHVAQEQFVTTALEEPLEGWFAPLVENGNVLHRHFEFGILAPVWAAVNSQTVRENRPWEKEADAFLEKCWS